MTGYEDAVQETARYTDEKVELTEDEKALLDMELQRLSDDIANRPQVTLTCFRSDKRKAGGAYVTTTGRLKKIDDLEGTLILASGERIVIEDIIEIR